MPSTNTHRLDSKTVTIIFAWQNGVPEIIWLGNRLDAELDLAVFVKSHTPPVGNATLDMPIPVSMLPESGRGFMGHPGLSAHRASENTKGWAGLFSFIDKRDIENGVIFTCTDETRGLKLEQTCTLDPQTNIAVFQSKLTNLAPEKLTVDWLSAPALSVPQSFSEVIGFSGRWCCEFTTDRHPIQIGQEVVENRRGRTSKEATPGAILLTPSTDEDRGACFGAHLAWSGNHKRILERMASGDSQLQMGLLALPGEIVLAQDESIETPELYISHSDQGLNGMSQNFHAHIRQNILNLPDPQKPRPVTVNTWEALYFDHDIKRLKALADAAQDVGAERYVLDDGWFTARNDDTTSLGDWHPDLQKYPNGLHPIVDYIVDEKGMEFGLWVEPEMVNADSNLYREHPDWVLQLQPYPLVEGRQQLVLDLTNSNVTDYLYERLSALLTEYRISYLKWDMNRDLVLPGDQSGSPATMRQTKALYALMDRLRAGFPHVEIESCASGGGRIDLEILKRTHRFWASDSNDAVERTRIQTGFSYFFPPETMGAHIGPTWCHTSGRGFHAEFRAIVASLGHMGLELDLTSISVEDLDLFRAAVARHKADRHIWHSGTLHRIRTVDSNLLGSAAISPDKKSARLVMMQIDRPRSVSPPLIQVKGLAPDTDYKIALQSGKDTAMRGTRKFNNPLMNGELELSGHLIETVGIQLPVMHAQSGIALSFEAAS